MTWHKDATPPDVHIPYAWTYANQTARESATGLVAADLGKFARQTDDDTIWMLIDESPVTWKFIGGGVGADTFLGLADTPNTYTGHGNKVVAVKATADGLEFVDLDLSEIIDHIDSTAIHFFEYEIDHRNIQYIGTYTHDEIDSHIDDGTIHFTESSVDHENIQNIGTYTHDEIDAHIDSTAEHFLETEIDHENIQNIGVNTHDDIDAHIADTTSNPHMVTLSDVGGAPVVHTHVEADITDLDHDAVKIQGVPVDDSAIADGKVLIYDSTSGDLRYEYLAEATGLTIASEWRFSTSTTDSDPGNGRFRLNNATQASSTFIYVDDISNQGADMSLLLSNLRSGDMVYIQQRDDSSRALLFEISGTPTDGVGYWKIPVQNGEATINDLQNNKVCAFLFHATGLHSVAWGSITGTLSNQTDLQTALDGKAPTVHTHVEADITDLDHDAQKIKGVVVDDTDIADGKALVYDSTTGNLQYEFVAAGDGEFSPEYQQATSEGESSTTSETYQLKLRLTTSDLPSGSYVIQWNYEVDGNGDHADSRVELNDTTELGFNRYDSSLNGYINVSGFALESLSGVNTIDIDYRTEDSPDQMDIRRARLSLWRVS